MRFAIRCCDFSRGFCEEVKEMPGEMMVSSLAVSTGLGVSVLAGIVTGVCYIAAYRVHRKRKNRPRKGECPVCGADFRSTDHILGGDDSVTCRPCRRRVCRRRCSTLNDEKDGWTCTECLRKPTRAGWYDAIIDAIRIDKKVYTTTKMHSEPLNEIDEDLEAARAKSKEQVQDFIEKLVNAMLGQNVDDASVTKLYNDQHYLPLEGQSPCTAHAALKQLIENLLKEALNLPSLQQTQNQSNSPQDLVNKTYEDLLATAILNKVVTNYQNGRPSSSSAASISSRNSSSSRTRNGKEYFFGEETLDDKWKTLDPESASMSSLESWIHSDSSFGSRKYVDKVTLTIKQDIEEVSQSDDSDNHAQDDTEYFRRKSSPTDEEEPNWFLQKRHFQGTNSPVPVPMLIPDPTTDAKVLIGDKEADETSDLSDAGSDYGDSESTPGRYRLLLESKTVIGGENPLRSGGGTDSSDDSGVKEVERKGGIRSGYISKADITVDDDYVEDASLLSIYSNTEKMAEYTEKYGSLPRTILKTPTPPSRYSLQENRKHIEKVRDRVESSDEEMEEQFSGVYSRREKEKWKHAVEMKNNPYSKEKLEKRITRSNSAVSSLFGSDYYARQASSPAGTRQNKSPEDQKLYGFPSAYDEDILFPEPSIRQKKQSSPVQYQEEDAGLHRAVPVIVHQEAELIQPAIKPRLNRPPDLPETDSIISEMTSDSDLSYVNFYDVQNAQVYKTTKGAPDENANTPTALDRNPQERPKYLKLKSTTTQPWTATPAGQLLRRHKSETDLMTDDSFDRPVTVISRKKDNTLISKIYLDPQVRNFAMSSRSGLPVEAQAQPVSAFRSQSSLSETTLSGSKDDLLNSLDSNQAKNYEIKSARMSLSSEDDVLSDRSASLNANRKSTRLSVYSSSDDLLSLSIEENEKPRQKKDNTLISKIYNQTNVRNYALSNRDYILKKSARSAEEVYSEEAKPMFTKEQFLENLKSFGTPTPDVREEDEQDGGINSPDPDIGEIAKRKIVHNFLTKFSESKTDLRKKTKTAGEDNQHENGDEEEINVSVRDLKKKFENNQGKSIVVSSLTARSISKQVKDYLKK